MSLTASVRSSTDTLRQRVLVNGRRRLVTGEPEALGGTNTAPTPHELLVAALAACVATTIRMYVRRKGWTIDEISVEADLDIEARAAAMPDQDRAPLRARGKGMATARVHRAGVRRAPNARTKRRLRTHHRARGEGLTSPVFAAGIEGLARRRHPQRISRPVDGQPGLFVVDATWDTIAPISLSPEVRTIGELEVLDRLRWHAACIDCRKPIYYAQGTLAGAVNISHQQIVARRDRLDPSRPDGDVLQRSAMHRRTAGDYGAARRRTPRPGAAVLPRRHPRLDHPRPPLHQP